MNPYLNALIGALILGIIIAVTMICVTVARYKMKLRAANYPLDKYAQMKLTESHDVFLRRSVVTKIFKSDKKK